MRELQKTAEEQLAKWQETDTLRMLHDTAREGAAVTRDGRKLLSFSCNDYLGLSQHARVKQAAIDAISRYGTGAGASRFITGNHPLYAELETRLAAMKKCDAAIVFGSGYLANIGIIPALVGRGDLILTDRLVHASLLDGARLSGAKMLRFTHNSVDACAKILKQHRADNRRCLIVTDHVFSMDGDVAPVAALYDLAEQSNAWLMTDDAHGLGILPSQPAHIQMGTLSKAVGSYGGYACVPARIRDYLHNSSRSLIYSTALPPATVAASVAALDIIVSDPALTQKPLIHARHFTKALGLPEAQSPIVPLILGSAADALAASAFLEAEGFLVSAIRPPTVAKGSARLRFTFSALHDKKDVDKLVDVIKNGPLKWSVVSG